MRIKIQTTARDLHDAIDAAWPRCPECDGTELSEDAGICWDCSASDYVIDNEEEEGRI